MCANQVRRQVEIYMHRVFVPQLECIRLFISHARLNSVNCITVLFLLVKKGTGSRNKRVSDNRRGATRTNQLTVFTVSLCVRSTRCVWRISRVTAVRANTFAHDHVRHTQRAIAPCVRADLRLRWRFRLA